MRDYVEQMSREDLETLAFSHYMLEARGLTLQQLKGMFAGDVTLATLAYSLANPQHD